MADNQKQNAIILSAAMLIVCLLFCCRSKSPEAVIADYLVQGGLVTNQDSLAIGQLADTLLDATVWKNRIRINRPYDADCVNIYIINGDELKIRADGITSPMRSNCSFLGRNIIFLDDAYLRSFLFKHHVPKDVPSNYLLGDQICFLYWVVGHELGHLVCGHHSAYFDSRSLDSFVKSSTLDNREELQADSFFVHAITPQVILRFSEERLMMDILNAELEQKVGKIRTMGVGIIYDYNDEQVVSYARQPTHPEYVIRLSRMLELSSRMSEDSGLSNLVGGFIKQLKEIDKR